MLITRHDCNLESNQITSVFMWVYVCIQVGYWLKWKAMNLLNQLIKYCHTTLNVSLKS